MPIISTFDEGPEGWTSTGSQIDWDENASVIASSEGGTGVWQFVAPDTYHGDRESYYGGTITFTIEQISNTNQFDDADITLIGAGVTLLYDFPNNPVGITFYSADLEASAGWRVGTLDGPLATEAQIRAVLADLTDFTIRGEFVSGATGDGSSLYDVALTEGDIQMPEVLPRITSNFTNSYDGWSFTGLVSDFARNPGAALSASDGGVDTWYWLAPEAYLGDKTAYFGGSLSFDLKQSATSNQFDSDDVILVGGGITLVLDIAPPGTDWTSYSAYLDSRSAWRVGSEDGPLATETQILHVLGDLQSFRIRGEYQIGADTGGLDNVVMEMFHHVEHHNGSGFADLLGRYPTMSDALPLVQDGDSLRVIGAPPAHIHNAGAVEISQNNLTIEGERGYFEYFRLAGTEQTLTLQGGASFAIQGTLGDDLLLAGNVSGLLQFAGFSGDDTVYGGSNNDTMHGQEGDDLLAGGNGDDYLDGGNGNDALWGAAGDDYLEGGSGDDTLGAGAGDDVLWGSSGDDALWAGDGNDQADGGVDNDTIGGAGGDDYLVGNSGHDALWGASGHDQLFGHSGNDTLGGFTGDDFLDGGSGNDEIWGSAGNDTASGGQGADQIGGGADNDYIVGGADNDSLYGGLGNDFVDGGSGDDLIYGAAGNDSLSGGTGDDTIYAGPGSDVINFYNGEGADVLYFFSATQDRLELDNALWDNRLTAAQVVSQFGSTVGSDFVLDFGAGNSVTLVGLGGVTGLESQIDIV